MSNPIQSKINQLFQQDIPKLTAAIDQEIKSKGMNPLGHLLSNSRHIGSKSLGICIAPVEVNFSIVNTTGLSQLEITNLTVATLQPMNAAQTQFHGTFSMKGSMQNIQSHITGLIKASCLFEHDSAGIGGQIELSAELIANGVFTVEVDNSQVRLVAISVQSQTLHLTRKSITISNLGLFYNFTSNLESLIQVNYMGQGEYTLQSILLTPVHAGFQKLLT